MCAFLDTVLYPERYHGRGKRPPFFEGWYFKLISADGSQRMAIIPAIFLHEDPAKAHAFVQVLNGASGTSAYYRHETSEFCDTPDPFDLHLGANRFSLESISLNIQSGGHSLVGEVRFGATAPWPVSLTSPGVMGPLAWLPFLETYHGVLSLDHALEGSLTVDGTEIDWTGGRGYIEKDWGRSFPAAWVWMQSNHFENSGTSLTASVASVPLGKLRFRGHIVGLWHGGQLYRFTTYLGARIERLTIGAREVHWVVRNRCQRLEIHALRSRAVELKGPSTVDMGVRVPESLSAQIAVRLCQLGHKARVIFEGTGRHAGLEVAGELRLLTGQAEQQT